MQAFPVNDPILSMPECDQLVLQAFVRCGVAQHTDSGNTIPLPWIEIRAYSNGNLSEWECEQVRLMSEQYCEYKAWATQHRYAKAPWQPELTKEQQMARSEFAMKELDKAFDI